MCHVYVDTTHFFLTLTDSAAKRSNSDGIGELLTALRRKGPRGLDALVEALEEEKEANQDLLDKIEAGLYHYLRILMCMCMYMYAPVSRTGKVCCLSISKN